MKFNRSTSKINSLKRLPPSIWLSGSTLPSRRNVTRAVNFRGIIIGEALTFTNDEDGFSSLLQWIQKLQTAHQLSAAIVGMEPTGHYWLNLTFACPL